jgi:uridylate kinase
MMNIQLKYKRVLLKIGGEALLGDREYGISKPACIKLAQEIKEIHDLGAEIALVVGGGNIFRGMAGEKAGFDRVTADYMGMLGTVINGLALMDAFETINVPVRIQSAIEMKSVCEPYIRLKALSHLKEGYVLILTAGTGDPYVTTDTGAALRALELNCEVLMKATKVNGVYDKDPKIHKDAVHLHNISYTEAIKSDNITVMDNSALSLANDHGLNLLIFNFFEEGNLKKAFLGEPIGTVVSKG